MNHIIKENEFILNYSKWRCDYDAFKYLGTIFSTKELPLKPVELTLSICNDLKLSTVNNFPGNIWNTCACNFERV